MDFSSANLDQSLLNAYLQTRYCIDSPPLCMQIGQSHPDLDDLLQKHQAHTWIFITAWNPASKPLPLSENRARQAQLEADIRRLRKTFFTGRGEAIDGDWEPEESLLVLDISKAKGIELGQVFQQNAIVFGRLRERAELVIMPKKM